MKASLLCLFCSSHLALFAAAPNLPEFDFTRPEVCKEWGSPHHLTALRATAEGLEAAINGEDPYFYGPARNYPDAMPLWLFLRVKSDEGGGGQIFYFRDQAREENSVRFSVEAGKWTDVQVAVPALGAGYRLRIDPPGTGGKTVISSMRFAPAAPLAAPAWPQPEAVDFTAADRMKSGRLELAITGRGFALAVDGQRVAQSHSRPLIGYVAGENLRWVDPVAAALESGRAEQVKDGIEVHSSFRDPDGATWRLVQHFAKGMIPEVFEVEVKIETDRDRAVVFLPVLLLVAGQGSPDTSKQQGLFAGLEYLDNEPTSSEADIIGPESKRQVPANHKITLPLMTIVKGGRYAGLIWEHTPQLSALFDSPDRSLGTGGHVMGVLFPGSDGFNRPEGSLLPSRPETLRAGQPLVIKAQLIGGVGSSVVPALQQYMRLRSLPSIVPCGYSRQEYVALAAHGWLDSKIRENNLFRHAVWQGFGAQPAADAALYMNWLAGETTDPALKARLAEAERGALSVVPPANLNHSAVGHVRFPVQALVYGHMAENAAAAQAQARGLLGRFAADGSIPYRKSAGHEDYGRTHFAPDANGLTAQVVETLLESAAFSGDAALIEQAVQRLHGLDKFHDSVPRGAQTWEVPLHTPDILASAHLVRAYTLGYELTGDKALLEQAIYWAWTGLPFVYLISPVGQNDRPYGTIAVYGATGWKAPVWFGRPVQWCGLVYADALYRLARHDAGGPWRQVADGITSVGIFYSWPPSDQNRHGLLPDVWEMLAHRRDGPAINPGTVQANAVRFFSHAPLYDFCVFRFRSQTLKVHAPGEIVPTLATDDVAKFTVGGWPRAPYYALVTGLARAPQLKIDGQAAPLAAPHEFQAKEGRLILKLSGRQSVEISSAPE
jgi:hypothetical protein